MATKVGGFTKSGVVQCVKLVEELGTPDMSGFDGSVQDNILILNNGWTLEFQDTSTSTVVPNVFNTIIEQIMIYSAGETGYLCLEMISSTACKAKVEPDNVTWWGKETDLVVTSIFVACTNGTQIMSNNVKLVINKNVAPPGVAKYEFQYNSGLSTSTSVNFQGIAMPIKTAERIKSVNVRMCKDGTLKCKELIEEEVVDNIDSFAVLQTSSIGPHTFSLENGTYIDLYENDTLVLVNFNRPGLIDCFQSGTPVLSISFTGHTSSSSQTEWNYNGSINILRISISFSVPPSNISNINRLTVNGTAFYTKSSNTTSTISFTLDGNSNSWNIPYNERFKSPTVRIYKDGTIKCAKLEEATLLPVAWGTPTQVGSYAQFNFPNGYQINVKSIADDSLCNIGSGDASKYRLNYIYNDGGSVDNLMVFSTEMVETTPAFYNSDSYINSASSEYNFGVYTQGVYLEILDPNKKQLGRLSSTNIDLSTSFGIVNSEDKEITIQLLDRNTPSWN